MDTILSDNAIQAKLQELNVAWAAIGNDYLVRSFETKDFAAGVELVNKIAKVADECHHHPDINLSYSRVELRVSTHSVAGITEKDFEFAKKVDEIISI